MKIKNLIILFPLFILSISGFSQTSIMGTVFSEENIPLEKVIISYISSSLSSVSNQEGQFEIPISDMKNDTLVIYSIGYETKKISDYLQNPKQEVILENKYKTIPEIVVSPIKVEAILDSILANISKNYPDNCLYTGTYKEGNFKNAILNKYYEASLQVDMLKNKKNKLFMNNNQSFKYTLDSLTANFRPILPEVIKNLQAVSIIKIIKSKLGTYQIKSSKSIYNDRQVLLITFKKQEDPDEYYRKLIIDAENFALLQFSNYVSSSKKYTSPNLVITSTASKLEINYRSYEGKYILSSVNAAILGESLEKKDAEKSSITSYVNFVVNNLCFSNCSYYKKTINSKKSISDQIPMNTKIILNSNIQNKEEYELLKSKL